MAKVELKIEPGISLGQWVYDRIAGSWPWIVSIVAGGGYCQLGDPWPERLGSARLAG